MNRGVQDGKKRLALPDYLGVGDPANDGKLLQLDSTAPGGVKLLPNGTFVAPFTTPESHGAVGDGITDDTAAWQAAINAIVTAGGGSIGYNPLKSYLIAGALQQGGTAKANSQLVIPMVAGPPTATVVLRFMAMDQRRGAFENFGSRTNLIPTLVSTLTGAVYSGTYGLPSVLGGPTLEQMGGSGSASWTNVHIQGDLWVRLPDNPSLFAINLEKCISASLGAVSVDVPATGGLLQPTHITGGGILMPSLNNYTTNRIDQLFLAGLYAGIVPNEHLLIEFYDIDGVVVPFAIRNGWYHPWRANWGQISSCPHMLAGYDPVTAGVTDVPALAQGNGGLYIDAHVEPGSGAAWQNIVDIVKDGNSVLAGGSKGSGIYYTLENAGYQTAPLSGGGNIGVWRKDLYGEVIVTNSAAESVASSGVWTTLTFDTNTFDPDGRHSTTVNTDRVNTLETGSYRFLASVTFASNATGLRGIRALNSGGTVVAEDLRTANSGDVTTMTLAGEVRSSGSGDYAQIQVYQTSGGALNVEQHANYSPYLRLMREK